MPEYVSPDLVENILLYVYSNPDHTPEDIASALRIRLSTVQDVIQLCENCAVLQKDKRRLVLSGTSKLRLTMKPWHSRKICDECKGRGIEISPEEFYGEYLKLLERRVSPDRSINQWQARPRAVCARVAYLIRNHATRRKRVLFLGDDDFASVGVGLYGDPKEVVVLDIDDRLLKVLADIAAEKGLRVRVVNHDLYNTLPAGFVETFDTTFGDPPYSFGGITTWLQRSIEALKSNGRGYLAIPYHDDLLQGPTTLASFFDYLFSREFAVTEMIHGFHDYEGIDEQRSSMVRFERIRPHFRMPEGPYWPGVELTAERIINRPKFDPQVAPFLEYLAGRRAENPLDND